MAKMIDLKGQRFGRLVVCRRTIPEPGCRQGVKWICKCDCGKGVIVLGGNLIRGLVKSCGCLRKEESAKRIGKVRNTKGRKPENTTPQS